MFTLMQIPTDFLVFGYNNFNSYKYSLFLYKNLVTTMKSRFFAID